MQKLSHTYVCASSTHCVIEVYSLLSCHSLVYGIGFVAVMVVSFVALLGVLMVPLVGKKGMTYVPAFLVAMGISALVSDAILHLLPHVRLHMPYSGLWFCTVQNVLTLVSFLNCIISCCMHTHTRTNARTHTHTHTQNSIHMYIHTRARVHTHTLPSLYSFFVVVLLSILHSSLPPSSSLILSLLVFPC